MNTRFAIFATAALLAVHPSGSFAQGKDGTVRKNDKRDYAELRDIPEKALARANPLEHDPEMVGAGAKLFEQHCAHCHGASAGGGRKGPSLLREPVRQASPGALFWILTNGVVQRGMPVWSKLPEPERWQIVGYLKSLETPPF
jgi:mono/diheme cytochrome c family protein